MINILKFIIEYLIKSIAQMLASVISILILIIAMLLWDTKFIDFAIEIQDRIWKKEK